MIDSSSSGDISSAEELGIDRGSGDSIPDGVMIEDNEDNEDNDGAGAAGLTGDSLRHSLTSLPPDHISKHIISESVPDHIRYDYIQPSHINLMDLKVDKQLKSKYLMIPKKNYLFGPDSAVVDMRRERILKYIMEGSQILSEDSDDQLKRDRRYSLDNLGNLERTATLNRCNSLNTILSQTVSSPYQTHNSGGLSEQENISGDSTNTENTESPMKQIMEHLDFQVSQRNERSHFILSELLIQTIEFLYSDEFLVRAASADAIALSSADGQTLFSESAIVLNDTSDRHSSTPLTACQFSSNANTVAVTVVEDVKCILSGIDNLEKFMNIFPPALKLLPSQIERQRDFSRSEKRFRPQMSLQISSEKSDSPSESIKEFFKTALESCILPVNIPVGLFPVMGSDNTLPTYVITMNPTSFNASNTLKIQGNKCPGCQHSFSSEIAKRLRLCKYYSFYFCSMCHNNTLMLIPAQILSSWDFTMLPVSCVARDLLKVIHSEPLFTIHHFSEKVRSLRVLNSVMRLRYQGCLFLKFIDRCRQGRSLKKISMKFPSHWLLQESKNFSITNFQFSIADFQLMVSGAMEEELTSYVRACVDHLSICPLCQAHGYFCEYCVTKKDVIFPFEIDKVYQCPKCHACFHIRCYNRKKTTQCPKCVRQKIRQDRITNELALSNI